MHGTSFEAVARVQGVRRELTGLDAVEAVLCPPFTALRDVAGALAGSVLQLGAQNVHWETEGAFTGEVSAGMLRDLGCRYVLVGHSERRTAFGETDLLVNRKTRAALDAGLRPIVCVGETNDQRESGRTEEVLRAQVEQGLAGLHPRLGDLVVAYEPVWAIGTGRTASAVQVQTAHEFIRALLSSLAGPAVAGQVRIQYGGSVTPANARELFSLPDVDGGLIGGASLVAESFGRIVRAAA